MHAPSRHNDLLSPWLPADLKRLFGPMECVELAGGRTLHEAGSRLQHVYFPVSALVSLSLGLKDGGMAELALVGSEGLVGVCAFLGQGRSMSRAVVQSAGTGLRLPAPALDQAARAEPQLMQSLLRYAQTLFRQMAQLAACGRHHALQARLCRWLLSHLDHRAGNDLLATHDEMAQGLGVRREGVSVAAQQLHQAGLIRYRRGHVQVLDRTGLEARSCECYAEVRESLAQAKRAAALATVLPAQTLRGMS